MERSVHKLWTISLNGISSSHTTSFSFKVRRSTNRLPYQLGHKIVFNAALKSSVLINFSRKGLELLLLNLSLKRPKWFSVRYLVHATFSMFREYLVHICKWVQDDEIDYDDYDDFGNIDLELDWDSIGSKEGLVLENFHRTFLKLAIQPGFIEQ